jgi:riboflavin kinase/FMN adenylyltransferase
VRAVEIAVGFFDGIHIGHRKIFDAMLSRASRMGARTVAMTFLNHPREVFAPEKAPKLLMSSKDRIAGIKNLGVNDVIAETFTQEVASISAAGFVEKLKSSYPTLDTVFCGPNWTFGKGGEGNPQFLRSCGINVCESSFAELNGEVVSSTRIRAAFEEGDVSLASLMLGRPYSLEGHVVKGKGLGRTIGYPTINLMFDFLPPLKFGVYSLSTPYGKAIANWGLAPTSGEHAWTSPVMEVHLLQMTEASFTPKENMIVEVKNFLRSERKFDSFESLKMQITHDIARVMREN